VGIEVQDTDPAAPVVFGHRGHVGMRHRVVAADHNRHGAGRAHLGHQPLDRAVRALGVGRDRLRVAVVDHGQHLEGVDA